MNPTPLIRLKILLLEDSDLDAELLIHTLTRSGLSFNLERVQTQTQYENALSSFRPDIILADYKLPTFDGASALRIAKYQCPDIPFIIISGAVGEEAAVELLRNGAIDFVLKGRLPRLPQVLRRALREVAERKARTQAERDLRILNEELESRIQERTRELLEKNTLMEQDLAMARELQLAFVPRSFPTLPHDADEASSAIRFSSIQHPTRLVSGDFFNVVRLSETAMGVLICDVMGHGVRAAIVTAMIRALEEKLDETIKDPGALLTGINRALCSILQNTDTVIFATAFYFVVDIANAIITFANAGHPSPLILEHQSGEVIPITKPTTTGPVLGIFKDATYQSAQRSVAEHDLVLLFTDGLFEAENTKAEPFTESRLRESILHRAGTKPQNLVQEIFAEVESFAQGCAFSDDISIIGMEVARLESDRNRLSEITPFLHSIDPKFPISA